LAWLVRHDAERALSTAVIAGIAYGIAKIRPDERAGRLERGLDEIRRAAFYLNECFLQWRARLPELPIKRRSMKPLMP
jgi:hypothetical protein